MPSPDTAIILVNWNGYQDTIHCIQSIKDSRDQNCTIVVVDNDSSNDSVKYIRAAHPDVLVIPTGSNLGFGGGNTVGVREAHRQGLPYVWLLNNDTLVFPDTLAHLRHAIESGEGDLIGCRIHEMADPGTVQSLGAGRVDFKLGRAHLITHTEELSQLDYITGTSLFMRTADYLSLNGFDPAFFMYWEDTDLSFRARNKGLRLHVALDAKILHKTSASSQIKSLNADRMFTTSSLTFFKRYARNDSYKIGILLRIGKRVTERKFKNVTLLLPFLFK